MLALSVARALRASAIAAGAVSSLRATSSSRNFSDESANSHESPPNGDVGHPSGASDQSTAGSSNARVYAELNNFPRLMLKEEILHIFRGCNLAPERTYMVYDERVRPKYWQVEFESTRDFEKAARILEKRPRVGTRKVRIRELPPTQAKPPDDNVNLKLKDFRDRSVLMLGTPDALRNESVERYFQGYSLAPQGIWHFWVEKGEPAKAFMRDRERLRSIVKEDSPLPSFTRERRTMVKFSTRDEALRAWRERTGGFLSDFAIDLRLIQ